MSKRVKKLNIKLKRVLSFSLYLLMILIITFLMITFVVEKTVVDGDSMKPELHDKDVVLIDKIFYKDNDPERFDIVVFPYRGSKGNETFVVKRIIALPGEKIRMSLDGSIFINDEQLADRYGVGENIDPGLCEKDIYLMSDEYFVLGDNREHSVDSRNPEIGNIKRNMIVGKAFLRIFPFNRFKIF